LLVGFSGGPDSTALLKATIDWARARGRQVIAATVDHRLNPDSAAWSIRAAEMAERLGARPLALTWRGRLRRICHPLHRLSQLDDGTGRI
jgi:tRNA(Ile)-lysidine synthase